MAKARKESRRWDQAEVLVFAALLWSLLPLPALWAFVTAYGAAWVVLNIVWVRWGRLPLRLLGAGPSRWGVIALVALVPIAQAIRHGSTLVDNEQLLGAEHGLRARMTLAREPAIFPRLCSLDRPQTFYVNAPGAQRLRLQLGTEARNAVAIGDGLFRVAYDPRRDGNPPVEDGSFDATLFVDGRVHSRQMLAVRPRAHPRWLHLSADRRRAATVSEETDELIVLDVGRESLETIEVLDGPVDLRFLMAGSAAVVAHRYDDRLRLIALPGGERIRDIQVGPLSHAMDLAPGGGEVALIQHTEEPRALVIELGGGATQAQASLDFTPDWVFFGERSDILVVAGRVPPMLHRFRRRGPRLYEDRPPLRLGRPAVVMSTDAERRHLVVAVTDYHSSAQPHLGNHFVQDQLLTVDIRRWTVVGQRQTAGRTARQRAPGNVDRGISPMGIALGNQGEMTVAFAGTDEIWHWSDGSVPAPQRRELPDALAAPHGVLALSPRRALVTSPSSGTIGFVDIDPPKNGRGRPDRILRLAPSDRDLLAAGADFVLQRRIGERDFYESTRAGISCQSCHLHAQSDGGQHNIGGQTLVATLDVRGLLGTPPFLRDGGYPTLGSLHELSRTLYRGYLRPQGGREISLDRYLASLPRPTHPRDFAPRDLARERRGYRAFRKARCALCHRPPAFTNLGSHMPQVLFSSGAQDALDTPSLLNLSTSQPYLVDGRAPTLASVFQQHDPRGRHGHHRALSEAEFEDLVHFLESL